MDYPNSIIMNKALNILAAAIVAAAMTAACGNKTEAPAQDADSTEVADSAAVADTAQAEAEASEAAKTINITAKGIGPIKPNMGIEDIPKSCPGLYDKTKEEADECDGVIIYFYKDGAEVFSIYSNGSNADQIMVEHSSNVRTPDGVYVGMPKDEFKAKGWKAAADGQYSKDGVSAMLDEKGTKVQYIYINAE